MARQRAAWHNIHTGSGFDQGKCLYLFHMGEAHGYKADKGLGVGAPKAGRTREGEAREARG
eukprot:scaffold39952_cov31-Tisochrysis_lutea.AAC.2